TLGRDGPPVVATYHGGRLAASPWLRRLQAAATRRLARGLFAQRELAEPLVAAGLLRPGQVAECMELSSTFRPQARAAARELTGMRGAPVFLCAGHLKPVKDPLTTLAGFDAIQQVWPQAELYWHYLEAELLAEVGAYLARRPGLAGRVHLRGPAPHASLETIYNSADFYLQASRREIGGSALLEAMACGCIPVVSDIPSFRAITAGGRFGLLFPVGDSAGLAARALDVELERLPVLAAAVRAHFEAELSYPALARRLSAIYAAARDEAGG
ncbi:MAG: glycosyltransferase family 4 protein, partial [Candidatus Promineifilaceae bacterium]